MLKDNDPEVSIYGDDYCHQFARRRGPGRPNREVELNGRLTRPRNYMLNNDSDSKQPTTMRGFSLITGSTKHGAGIRRTESMTN
jgi:hypothetical protein